MSGWFGMHEVFGEGHKPRHGTVGWLAELFYRRSEAEADAALADHLPDATVEDHCVIRPDDAPRVLRTDAPESVGISYHAYNPPSIWGAGYTVLKVAFPAAVPADFMSHAGEELLMPVSGKVQYHFFWAPPGEGPRRQELTRPVAPLELIRINPQIPHHTWGAEEPAVAWMIIRDVSEVPAVISLDPSIPTRGPVELHPRTLSSEALVDPSRYALSAWGISERIRLHRERAGLGGQELAALADVDPAQLSRLEAGARNLSLDALLRIARILRIPLMDLIETAKWCYQRSGQPAISTEGVPEALLERPLGLRHWLHPSQLVLGAGWHGGVRGTDPEAAGDFTTWIVLEGRILLLEKDGSQGSVVSEGSVIHFRTERPREVESLTEARLLQVRDSGTCTCLPHAPQAVD